MSQKEILLKLAEEIDAVIAEIEEGRQAEKVAATRSLSSLGKIGSTPAFNTNPMMNFLFNQ